MKVPEERKATNKAANLIPENERWLHRPEAKARLDAAIRWAEEHPETRPSDLDEFERRIDG